VSTPRYLDLPDQVRPAAIASQRGAFAALEALPASGVCERRPALLVPGFTGSKEDFIPVLQSLAAAGRRVVAIDMLGQYESQGSTDPGRYAPDELAADVAAAAGALAPDGYGVHLLGHALGGLIARDAALAAATPLVSLTLLSSGPGSLSSERAGLVAMGRYLLTCPDRTAELASLGGPPILVLYGENDDAWRPAVQERMARRLGAERVCIPGAGHSPAVEAPETTASTLSAFWRAAESSSRHGARAAAGERHSGQAAAAGPSGAAGRPAGAPVFPAPSPSHGRRGSEAWIPSGQWAR
jgi:pimeloyl-ACP methyl ester carboxylesterase